MELRVCAGTSVTNHLHERLRWSGGTRVRGFEPDRSRRIFQGEKILIMPSFGGEVKPSVPCRRFASCKRSLQMAWNLSFVGKITDHFSRIVPPLPARGLSRCRKREGAWRCKWELPNPGSYNKPTWLQNFQGHQPPGPNGRRRRRRRRKIRTTYTVA
jgi:hypothetical protein